MRRRLAAALLILCAATAVFLLAGPDLRANRGAGEGRKYLVGLSQANLVEPWRVTMTREIEEAAARYPDLRVIIADATQDSTRQIEDVQMLMGYGIDLMIISPNDREALRPAIASVYEKIPVIVLDRDVGEGECSLYIGPDNYQIGWMAGCRVGEMLGEAGGNVLEIRGSENSPPVAERSAGFAAGISLYDHVSIIKSLSANWMQDQAEDRFKEFVPVARQPIDVVFAHNDAMAYGAYIAAREMRVPGVRFVGVDGLSGDPGGVELVDMGILEATFFCGTGGEQAVEYAIRILRGDKDLPNSIILEPVEIRKGAS